MRAIAWIVLLALASGAAAAQSDCDRPRDDFDDLYCLNKVYVQADADLNAAYQRLRARLDTAGRERLRTVQLAWIERRNSACSWRDGRGFWVNLGCATRMTVERVNFLNDRHRECVSSGCRPGRLG